MRLHSQSGIVIDPSFRVTHILCTPRSVGRTMKPTPAFSPPAPPCSMQHPLVNRRWTRGDLAEAVPQLTLASILMIVLRCSALNSHKTLTDVAVRSTPGPLQESVLGVSPGQESWVTLPALPPVPGFLC